MPDTPIVLFDGACGFCTWCVRFAHVRVKADLIYLPYQSVDLESLQVELSNAEKSVQFVSDGRVLQSSAAVKAIFSHGSKPFQMLATVMGLPVLRDLMEAGYWWVAKHRGKLPGIQPPLSSTDE